MAQGAGASETALAATRVESRWRLADGAAMLWYGSRRAARPVGPELIVFSDVRHVPLQAVTISLLVGATAFVSRRTRVGLASGGETNR
ncbi:hypothetical protein [Inquilinus sp.]|jgi:hypothetical protein|uniref:hypothetical protein n=1 Tax=Inquilinus sp. TaxID=1932117 RepID=UPI003784738B